MNRLTHQREWTDDIDLTQELGYKYIFQGLAEYENAEEQGLLVRLPCKIGSTVWVLLQRKLKMEVIKGTVKNVLHYDDGTWWVTFSDIWIDKQFKDFGKTVFLTREAAENALAEREWEET